MKMRSLLVLLACVSGMALAEWTQLGTTNSGMTSYFLDLNTRQETSAGKVKLSYLFDLQTPDQSGVKPALSVIGENEYDCKARRYHSMGTIKLAGNMGTGDVVATSTGSEEWSQIPPRSRVARMFKVACATPDRVMVQVPPVLIHQSAFLRRQR
jgi:hypothetical protein